MADQTNNSLLDIANNGAALNQAISELTTNVAKLSSITLPVANGGTGLTASGTSGNVLTSNGTTWQSSPIPASGVTSIAFGTTGLTPSAASSGAVSVAGTLNVANGGTGLSSLTAYGVLCGGTTTTGAAQSLATGTSGQVLTSAGSSAVPQFQTLTQSQLSSAFNATGTAPFYACRAWVNFNGVPATGTYSQSGTTITVTITSHGMTTGMIANLSFTSGTATSGSYAITSTGTNTFTVTSASSASTSGNVTRNTYIRGSGNVSTVARNGTGDYTITFVTALSDANYSATCEASPGGVLNSSYLSILYCSVYAAGSLRLQSAGDYPSAGTNDKATVSVAVFR